MKRLLAAAVLAVSLHVLILSLRGGRLVRRAPVWLPPPVTVMIAGLSWQAAGGKEKTAVQVSPATAPHRIPRRIKPKRAAVKSAEKIKKIFHKALAPQRKQKQVLKPKTSPLPLNAASGRQPVKPAPPASARPVPASMKDGAAAKTPVSRKNRSEGQSSNLSAPAAASAVHVATPLYWRNPPPRYPVLARQRRYTGTVILEVLVDGKGGASEVRVVRSSGYSLLDEAALAAVRRWQFAPGTEGGRPTAMRVKVPIRFRLQ